MLALLLLACTGYELEADHWLDIDDDSPHAEDADLFASSVLDRILMWNGALVSTPQAGMPASCASILQEEDELDITPAWVCITTTGGTYRMQLVGTYSNKIQLIVWP